MGCTTSAFDLQAVNDHVKDGVVVARDFAFENMSQKTATKVVRILQQVGVGTLVRDLCIDRDGRLSLIVRIDAGQTLPLTMQLRRAGIHIGSEFSTALWRAT
jgi:hypothetical protein